MVSNKRGSSPLASEAKCHAPVRSPGFKKIATVGSFGNCSHWSLGNVGVYERRRMHGTPRPRRSRLQPRWDSALLNLWFESRRRTSTFCQILRFLIFLQNFKSCLKSECAWSNLCLSLRVRAHLVWRLRHCDIFYCLHNLSLINSLYANLEWFRKQRILGFWVFGFLKLVN